MRGVKVESLGKPRLQRFSQYFWDIYNDRAYTSERHTNRAQDRRVLAQLDKERPALERFWSFGQKEEYDGSLIGFDEE